MTPYVKCKATPSDEILSSTGGSIPKYEPVMISKSTQTEWEEVDNKYKEIVSALVMDKFNKAFERIQSKSLKRKLKNCHIFNLEHFLCQRVTSEQVCCQNGISNGIYVKDTENSIITGEEIEGGGLLENLDYVRLLKGSQNNACIFTNITFNSGESGHPLGNSFSNLADVSMRLERTFL